MVKIRAYRPEDLETLWKIDQQCFPRGISYDRRELAWFIESPLSLTLVAEKSGSIFAFLIGQRESEGDDHTGRIITIDVLPEGRGNGTGSRLMAQAEKSFAKAGCTHVELEAAIDNADALAFYEKLGYIRVGAIPRYYLNRIDALVLKKSLKASRATAEPAPPDSVSSK